MQENSGIIERYGENLTNKTYITNPAIGRDEEIKKMILVLLTPDKSPILTGKPGIGKTAIVEGISYLIQKDEVPNALKGYTIVKIDTQALIGTVKETGDTRIQTLVDEIKQRDKFILFIDEIHTLIGAKSDGALDFANMFKTGLGRGDIKIIGATTSDEYERYILRDKAFTRRFQRIDVSEPTQEETVKILMGTLKKIEHKSGAKLAYSTYIQEKIMKFIVEVNKEYNRVYETAGRYPDVALNMLSQAFSEAVFDNKDIVTIEHVESALLNSKAIYEDVIKKYHEQFKIQFKDLLDQEEEYKREVLGSVENEIKQDN